MDEMTMKIGLVELFNLVGIDKGINFYYEELPGVLVTIGFTQGEDYDERIYDEGNDDEDDGFGNGSDDGSDGGHIH